jgi:4-amino-4-deoxy-L-arabinose transferase-like glycosyltransferase
MPEEAEALADVVSLNKRLYPTSPVGFLRLFYGQFAAQTTWLLPLAVAGLILGRRRRRPDQPTLDPRTLSLGFWFAWTAIFWIVYSYLGGIVHFYYLATLAPALAALAGIGAASLWERNRERASMLAPALLILTLLWQFHVECSGLGWTLPALWAQPEPWLGWLHTGTIVGVLLGSAGLAYATFRKVGQPWLAGSSLSLGVAALVALPTAWAMSSVVLPGKGVVPCPDLQRLVTARRDPEAFRLAHFGRTTDTSGLVPFLLANRQGETYLLATSTIEYAAPIIIQTGEAVMARGGYHGLDGAVDPDKMANFVQTGQVRFALVNDIATISRRLGGEVASRPVAHWIRAHGQLVDPAFWGGSGPYRHVQLYDLSPQKGLRALAPGALGSQ